MSQTNAKLKDIANLLQSADKSIKKAQRLLESLSSEAGGNFDDVPGVLGVFDGENMVAPDGQTYEVNPNYAAKSMLVVGDNLKMIEENGKQLFKQVSKVSRKQVKGILNKKEGKWYALTDAGSYRVLDVAVDFRRGAVNDEVSVLVPEDNLDSPYGALEKIAKEDTRPIIDPEKAEGMKAEDKPAKTKAKAKEEKKEERKPAKKVTKKASTTKKPAKAKTTKKAKAEVDSLLDDDLV